MENNLRTIRHAKLIVRLVYVAQVIRIETDYWFPLMAQDDKMLQIIQY